MVENDCGAGFMANANRSTGFVTGWAEATLAPFHFRTLFCLVLCGFLLSGFNRAFADDADDEKEPVAVASQTVFATILYKLPAYIDWPTNTLAGTNHLASTNAPAGTNSPWRIGLLGPSPLDDIMEKAVQNRLQQQRGFAVYHAATVEQLPECDIVFISLKTRSERHAALKALNGRPVLTVSPAAGFLEDGGVIRLRVRRTVEMEINLDQARANGLGIQTRLLEVAYNVMENGKMRKLR
jgi:hypothetical protein